MRFAVCSFVSALASTVFAAGAVAVLPDNPTAVEKSAAIELAEGLGKVLGVQVPTVAEKDAPADAVKFFVGATTALDALRSDKTWKTDEVLLKSVPGGVVLAGDPARAPLYAVDLYLETYCGVRWWTSTEADYPRLENAPVENVDYSFAPPFAYRETYYLDGFDPTFKVRSKGNFSSLTRFMFTDMAFIPPEKGGNHRLYFFEGRHSAYHSFFEILAPSNYFKAHPDWFSLVKGKRVPKQLCLSNVEMKKAYIAETLRRLREDSSVDFIQVSQNDWNGACECAACKALEAEDGGVPSGPYLRFANEVAEAVEREFPNVRVDTFAYQFTRKAPTKTRPRHNVVVRLCDIECDFSTPLAEGRHARNAAFVKDLQDWSRVASGRLFIWDYLANFTSYMMPHPNIRSIAPNIRLFRDTGATGIFEQGDALCSAGNFVALRHYLTSHLLWNPAADENLLIEEFLKGYYGKRAFPYLKLYLERIESAPRQKGAFVGCYHKAAEFLTPDEALDAAALMRKAVRAAEKDGEVFARRVRREELSVDHLFILCWDDYRVAAEKRDLRWDRPASRKEAIEKWAADCAAYGVLAYRETVKRELFPEYLKKLRAE